MKVETIHLFVSGRVQGVGFRWATRSEASRLGLTGWVRNLPDDRVEIHAEGNSDQIAGFLEWCDTGPGGAQVTAVEVLERKAVEVPVFERFEIRR